MHPGWPATLRACRTTHRSTPAVVANICEHRSRIPAIGLAGALVDGQPLLHVRDINLAEGARDWDVRHNNMARCIQHSGSWTNGTAG